MTLPVLIVGAGGHGRVVADLVREGGRVLRGFLDEDTSLHRKTIAGVAVLGGDDHLKLLMPAQVTLANGIGATDSLVPRSRIFERMSAAGFGFEALIHLRAIVASSATLAAGVQIFAGAVVQSGAQIADNVIINTGAVVDHDCIISRHTHVAPGAILCGNVHLGEGCYVGAGSTIIQGIRIGSGAFIAAGSVVIADVSNGARVAGVPARIMGSR